MKPLLIVNPVSGQTRPNDNCNALIDQLPLDAGGVVITDGPGVARKASFDAAFSEINYDSLWIAGGDGTVNEAINGLQDAVARGGKRLPLGIVPRGTQNVLAFELGLPHSDVLASAQMLKAQRTRTIDLGMADGRYFSLMAGFGFDAAVVDGVERPIKELIGPAAYAFATLGTLARYRSTRMRLTLDGETTHTDAYLVVVANAASYAYRQIKLAPFATLDDGWLDVCVFERAPSDRVGFATQIMAVLARRHLRDPRVRYYRAREIEIISEPAIHGQLDGERSGQTPVNIRIMPGAIDLIVP